MKMGKKNKAGKGFWSAQSSAFITGFKDFANARFWRTAVFDLLTIIVFILIINLAFSFINYLSADALPEVMDLYVLRQSGDAEAFTQALIESAPVLEKLLWYSLIIIAVSLLLVTFFISWFYGKAWCFALKKKFNLLYLRKYFFINLLWFIAWFIIFLITVNIFITAYAAIIVFIELLIFFYSDFVLRSVFDEKKKLRFCFSDCFKIAKKIYWFIPFLIIAIILFLIMLSVAGLFVNIQILFMILIIIFTVLFIGWARNHIIKLVNYLS